jgi:hypothetical protein
LRKRPIAFTPFSNKKLLDNSLGITTFYDPSIFKEYSFKKLKKLNIKGEKILKKLKKNIIN